jgi:ankyrin repeat protein
MHNWKSIGKMIKNKTINYDKLVDQINYPLHYLAYNLKNDLIKTVPKDILTEYGSVPNIEGDTIYHIASKLGNTKLFEYMISQNSDLIYQPNHLGLTPLYYLVSNEEFTKKFVEKNHIRDHWISPEQTLVDYYIINDSTQMVEYLLNHMKIGPHNLFTIMEADVKTLDKIKLLKLFLKKKISLNALDKKTYFSPLIMATYADDSELVDFLLKNGADPNYAGPENSDCPLAIAIFHENDKIVKKLIDSKVDVNTQNKYMQTPIHYMYLYQKTLALKTTKELLQSISNFNLPDNQMNTILSLLLQYDDWRSYMPILAKHQLQIYLPNKLGKRPIDYVKETEKEDFYQLVYQSYLNQLHSNPHSKWADPMDNQLAKSVIDQDQQKYILNKIINQQISYPIPKDDVPTIKILNAPKTNITHFSANTGNYICFLYYLLKKYPSIKVPGMATGQMEINGRKKKLEEYYAELTKNFRSDSQDDKTFRSIIKDHINHSPVLPNHLIIWKNSEKYFFSPYIIQGIQQTLKSYPLTKLILLKLSIIIDDLIHHANVLILDTGNKTIERFDPYGKVPFIDSQSIDLLLKTFFMDYLSDWKYRGVDELFGGISFQVYSDENNSSSYIENDPVGFCVAWCCWYVEMRINNGEIDPSKLIKESISKLNRSKTSFKEYIRNYSDYLDREKNLIMESAGVPSDYWYASEFPIPLYLSYIKNIREMFEKIL